MAELTREQAALEEAFPSKFEYLNDLKDYGYPGQKGFISRSTYRDGRNVINVFFDGQDPKQHEPVEVIKDGVNPALEAAFNKAFPKPQDPSVPSSANVTSRYVQTNEDGTIKRDENGNSISAQNPDGTLMPGAIIENVNPQGTVTGTEVLKPGDANAAELARQRADPAHPGLTNDQHADNLRQAAAAERQRNIDAQNATNDVEKNRLELIRIQTAQRLAGVQESQLAQSIDDAKKPQKLPDGTFVAWDKNENGEWIARKVNNATSGPKGMAESHDSALADMRLGTVAKASQNYMTELLRRTSLPPNDPEFMTSEQASAAMTSFISEGDIFLREQQGLLGEQSKVQATQLTQRNQDLMEVQSRRNFQQTNVQQAAQHDTDVNKYLSAKDAHLAGPGFLGQIMLTNNLAGQYGGMDAVPQIQQTPLQQNLMAVPAFMGGAPAPVPPVAQAVSVPPAMVVPQQ